MGPSQESGEQRSLKIGSVRMVRPTKRSRKVAWPMKVTWMSSGLAIVGGGGNLRLGGCGGQAVRWPDRRHFSTCWKPRGGSPPGLKKWVPSQWSDGGNAWGGMR